ncbi:MAG: hypothetical protein AMXMBFR46_25310 [Acidimicrobiia bacterium]
MILALVVIAAAVFAWTQRVGAAGVAGGLGVGDERRSGEVHRGVQKGSPTVRIVVEHSRFEPEVVRVRPRTEVRFVVVNRDPIGHELIVGDDEVHDRHRNGTEAYHPPEPGEVSVDAGARASTTYTFAEPGRYEFACHLPGHYAYGMRGVVVVKDAVP